jgi:class 3 adenylate cyclase
MANTWSVNFTSSFIPDLYKKDEEMYRKARLLVLTSFITSFFSSFYAINSYLAQMPHLLGAMLFNVFGFLLLPFLFRAKILNLTAAVNMYILVGSLGVGICVFYSGGLHSSTLPWFSVLPIASLMMSNKKWGWVWTIVSYLSITIFGYLTLKGIEMPNEIQMSPAATKIFHTANLNGLVLLIYLIALVFENTKNTALNNLDEKNKLLDKEKKRSDELLLNILPADVVEELKQTGRTRARHYKMVSVIFTDFKDFTKASEKLSPEELVNTIDEYYEAFDNLLAQYNAEKIKTVGDAYICAVGIPLESKDNALKAVKLSMEILRVVMALKHNLTKEGRTSFDIRIGVHTCPLIAGVVGIKKFAYDIWGDTVNTAARMQESGETNRINISQSTYEHVKDDFNCTHRGKIPAKNKGEIDMYFVDPLS